jgi:hypothetical protein
VTGNPVSERAKVTLREMEADKTMIENGGRKPSGIG